MNAAFQSWVDKWGIGPGMNDIARIEHANNGRTLRQEPLLPLPTRYTGYDGSVGPGWVPLLDQLAADLKAMGWDGSVKQIKEKFGTLRFYAVPNGVPPEQHAAFRERIVQAEFESGRICEDCGAPGTSGPRPGRYWILTLCDTCRSTPVSESMYA